MFTLSETTLFILSNCFFEQSHIFFNLILSSLIYTDGSYIARL